MSEGTAGELERLLERIGETEFERPMWRLRLELIEGIRSAVAELRELHKRRNCDVVVCTDRREDSNG